MNKQCSCISCVNPTFCVGDPVNKGLKRKREVEQEGETSCLSIATEIDSLWDQLLQLNSEVKSSIPEIYDHISKLNKRTRENKHKIEQLMSLNQPQDSDSGDTEGVDQSIVGESEPDTEEEEGSEEEERDEEDDGYEAEEKDGNEDENEGEEYNEDEEEGSDEGN